MPSIILRANGTTFLEISKSNFRPEAIHKLAKAMEKIRNGLRAYKSKKSIIVPLSKKKSPRGRYQVDKGDIKELIEPMRQRPWGFPVACDTTTCNKAQPAGAPPYAPQRGRYN
jgi:hypothetical protein